MTLPSSSTVDTHPTRALILSGGGAFGAYEAGVIHALARGQSPATGYRPFYPRILTGTSVGAYNAAYLASRWDRPFPQAARELQNTWLDRISDQKHRFGNGVLRYRLNPFEFLNLRLLLERPGQALGHAADDIRSQVPLVTHTVRTLLGPKNIDSGTRLASLLDVSAFVSNSPMAATIAETIDFDKIVRSPHHLSIVAARWNSGKLLVAHETDLGPRRGPKLTKGSASIPGFFTPDRYGEEHLVDGGLLLNTPLDPAIQAGVDELFVVTLSPKDNTIPPMHFSALGTLLRSQDISWERQVAVAVTVIRFANYFLAKQARFQKTADRELDRAFQVFLRYVVHQTNEGLAAVLGKRLRPLTVYIMRPSEYLGLGPLGILNFKRGQIARLIALGMRDTKRHECDKNGCVIATDPSTFTPIPSAMEGGMLL